jgi:hypothetical protein
MLSLRFQRAIIRSALAKNFCRLYAQQQFKNQAPMHNIDLPLPHAPRRQCSKSAANQILATLTDIGRTTRLNQQSGRAKKGLTKLERDCRPRLPNYYSP